MGRRTSARGGGGAAWPSTASALVAGDGSSVTVGSGLSLAGGTLAATASGPGSRPALDANHLLAYYCNETSGTTIANSGTTASANLTLAGTYSIGDGGLYSRGTSALRLYGSLTTDDGAFCSSTSQFSIPESSGGITSDWTLEAVVMPTGGSGVIFELASGTRTGASNTILAISVSGTNFSSQYYYTGTNNMLTASGAAATGLRAHVAFVKTSAAITGMSANTVNMFVNGIFISSAPATFVLAGNALTQCAVGNNCKPSLNGGAGNNPFKGLIADVRVSNVARNQTYLIAATKAMGGL